MANIKLALVQLNTTDNAQLNLNKIANMVKTASARADLVILPEHADGISESGNEFVCDINGKVPNFYSNLAKDCNIYLHCGSFTQNNNNGKPYNTSALFAPNGDLIATYSKLHMFNAVGCMESDTTSAGNDIVVADTALGKIGLSICYDLRFAGQYRAMALMGAKLMIVSANFTAQTGKYHWQVLLQARAIENGCFVAGVNQCGTNALSKAYGNTMLIDPWGKIIGKLGDDEDILYATINLDDVEAVREKMPSIKNRRTDIYNAYID